MNYSENLHTVTQYAMNDLQSAFIKCSEKSIESHILSAIVSLKMLHDKLTSPELSCPDIDPEEYCCAI